MAKFTLARFANERTGWPIVVFAGVGTLVATALVLYMVYCDERSAFCATVRARPPWILVTGVAAAPSLLLTWFWRVSHRKRDLNQKQEEIVLEKQRRQDAMDLAKHEAELRTASEARMQLFIRAAEDLARAVQDVESTVSLASAAAGYVVVNSGDGADTVTLEKCNRAMHKMHEAVFGPTASVVFLPPAMDSKLTAARAALRDAARDLSALRQKEVSQGDAQKGVNNSSARWGPIVGEFLRAATAWKRDEWARWFPPRESEKDPQVKDVSSDS